MFLGERIQQFRKSVFGDFNSPVTQFSACNHHMVVTLVVHSAKTHIKVEITDSEGGIRATSVLCLLGLGLGLGSLLVYRFCTRLFTSSSRNKTSSSGNQKQDRALLNDNSVKAATKCNNTRAASRAINACNSGTDSEQTSPEGTVDSGISSSSSTNTMGNISSSPDTSYSAFYSNAEGVRFRGPMGPGGDRRGSTDSDGFVHVPTIRTHHHGDDDGESGVSLMSTSPESEEIHKLLSQGLNNRTSKYKQLHIDIPHGHSRKMVGSTSINSLDESDAGLGFSPTNSIDLQNSDNISLSGHSMMANFSPVSLHERNLKLGPDDSLAELDRSTCRRVPAISRNRQHSTPLSDSSRSMSSSSSVPEDMKILDDKGAEGNRRVVSSHSSYSLGLGESFNQSSINDSRSQSVDFSDSLSGVATPDSDFFNAGDVGLQTQEGMSILENDLKEVQQEISEISEKIQRMCGKENLRIPSAVTIGPEIYKSVGPKSPEVQKAFTVLSRHKSNSSTEGSFRDESASEFCSKDNTDTGTKNFSHSGEFMWDCRSDLNVEHGEQDRKRFHNHWASLDASSERSSPSHLISPSGSSPCHGDIPMPLPSHSASMNSFQDLTPDSSRHGSVSVNDIYIDDGFSGLASRTDSRISFDSVSAKSGSFPSSIASSAHTSPRHFSPIRAAPSPPVTAADDVDADSSNNNAAEACITHAEDLKDDNNELLQTQSPQKTLEASVDTNKNPTVNAATNRKTTTTDIVNVGPKIELKKYVEQEWKGTTKTANTVRQGYASIPELLGKQHIRRVRGDNYCAIRASIYQCLVNDIDIASHIAKHTNLTKELPVFGSNLHTYLGKWGFGGRVKIPSCQIQSTIKQFVNCLFRQVKGVRELSGTSCKEDLISALLNNKQSVDLQMMEATKALMMLAALRLHQDYTADQPVPTFVWLMFARDTSLDPKSFFENHLNPVGDAAGLEQVEMFLLAYTLGIDIEVVRPSQCGSEDFITNFVDDTHNGSPLPKVLLIAEDDRHYNVLV